MVCLAARTRDTRRSSLASHVGGALSSLAHEDATFKELLYEDPMSNLNDVVGPMSSVLANFRELKLTSQASAVRRARRLRLDLPYYSLPLDDASAGSVGSGTGGSGGGTGGLSLRTGNTMSITMADMTMSAGAGSTLGRPVTDKIVYLR